MKNGFLIVMVAVLVFGGCNNYFHELARPDDNRIISFAVPGQEGPSVISENTVTISADEDLDIRSLVPAITVSPKAELIPLTLEYIQTAFPSAHVSSRAAGMYTRDDFADHLFDLIREDNNFNIPDLSVPIDFSEPVDFFVISEKGNIRRYTVNVVRPMPVTIAVIDGVTLPVAYEVPVTTVTETAQYTGTVTWSPAVEGTFELETVYTATITLTPKPGFTFKRVEADFFTVAGAEANNAANSGVVTAVFPPTKPPIPVTPGAINGVTVPVILETPVTTVTETEQYTGTVTWSPTVSGTFAGGTVYTATITLTAKSGYTLRDVPANSFTVAGADPVSNGAGSGVVTAVFPATEVTINTAIQGVTPPATLEEPVTTVTETEQYTATLTWSPAVSGTFAPLTVYTATITLTAKSGYTLQGVAANSFTVAGAAASNGANSGVVTAVFPATGQIAISGITPPASAGWDEPVTIVTETDQFTGTVTWSPVVPDGIFEANTVYTATITLTAKPGYDFSGTPANTFTVAGTSSPASNNSGVVTAVFPKTDSILRIVMDLEVMTDTNSNWHTLLRRIEEKGEMVDLDLSRCVIEGDVGPNRTVFNPDNGWLALGNLERETAYGKALIKSIILPDTAVSTAAGFYYPSNSSGSIPSFLYFDILESFEGKNLTTIGDAAFCQINYTNPSIHFTPKLSSIPDGLVYIGGEAFRGCTGLTMINLSKAIEIGSIAGVGGPYTVGEDKARAFAGCTNLTEVTLGNDLVIIGNYAFSGCTSLKNITLPYGLEIIGFVAFSDCESLTEITLPDSLTYIDQSVFAGCKSLTEFTWPDCLESIPFGTFGDCTGLKKLTLPATLKFINTAAFVRCTGLTELTLPDGLETIGSAVFDECRGLTKVTLPATLTSIGGSAFRWCDLLTTVICNATTPPTLDNGAYTATFIATPASPLVMKIFVPAGTVGAYQAAWSSVASRIETMP